MKNIFVAAGLSITALTGVVDGAALALDPRQLSRKILEARALPANAPHGYTPQVNQCPSNQPTIRSAASLSDEETSWLRTRRQAIVDPMRNLLRRLNINGLDTDQYINRLQNNLSSLPNIGIAISGGGYRAMLNGAGVLEAFDSRTPNSTSAGQLGGLLQSATYISGLSGGSWLVGSLYTNNFTSVNEIISEDSEDDDSGDIWQFGNSIFEGPDQGGIQLFDSADYYTELLRQTDNKRDAGFNLSITDYWGRALSYQLVNASEGGPEYTFSSIAQQNWFTNGEVPMPFIVADGRRPGETLVSANTTVYSFNPWELGSEDPTIYGFASLQYVGTNFTDGSPRTDECVTGFDNVGFIMGTSSSLFNTLITGVQGNTSSAWEDILQGAISGVLSAIGEADNDIADYPNPFYHYHGDENPVTEDIQLTLVDGGEDGQNIPFHPLIQPYRHVDVIFAVDSSADSNASYPTQGSAPNWPLGLAMIASYERSQADIGNGTAFPRVPEVETFVNLGLNRRPTFFGCNAADLSGSPPLIVYLPNAPYVYNSNVSTFDLSYNDTERNAIVLNGYNLATQGNGTIDEDWPTCVGCAILSRSLDRTNTDVPDVCRQCFNQYCWDGNTDNSTPDPYQPNTRLQEVSVTGAAGRFTASAMLATAAAITSAFFLV